MIEVSALSCSELSAGTATSTQIHLNLLWFLKKLCRTATELLNLQIISPRSSYSQFNLCLEAEWPSNMAVFSALKNKKNQKLREGLEDLALKCGELTEKDEVNVEVGWISLKPEYFQIFPNILTDWLCRETVGAAEHQAEWEGPEQATEDLHSGWKDPKVLQRLWTD